MLNTIYMRKESVKINYNEPLIFELIFFRSMGFMSIEEINNIWLKVRDVRKIWHQSQVVCSFKWPIYFDRVECEQRNTRDHRTQSGIL